MVQADCVRQSALRIEREDIHPLNSSMAASSLTEGATPVVAARYRAPPPARGRARAALQWPLVLATAILVTLGLAAWFVFSARAVTFAPQPSDATLSLPAAWFLRLGNHWLIQPGRHRVLARAPGYRDFDRAVSVGDAHIQTIAIELERLPGRLVFELEPAVAAKLSMDGEAIDEFSGRLADVPAGAHEFVLEAPRYRTVTLTLEVEGKGIEQRVALKLEPAWAEFILDSSPRGARVQVDGRELGSTPHSGELIEGRRTVRLERAGYKAWQQSVKVVAGQRVALGTIVLDKADGLLALRSTPSAASVTLDDVFVGRTPLEFALTPDTAHRVRVSAPGYSSHELALELAPAARREIDLQLVAELAAVRFTTVPEDAELLVDGQPSGSANQLLSLPTREHEIAIRRPGYATHTMRVTPRSGVEKRLRVRLKTIAEAARDAPSAAGVGGGAAGSGQSGAAADQVTTFAGQRLRLLRGGRARLGTGQSEVVLARAFYVGEREVTNAEFRRFLATYTSAAAGDVAHDDADQPALGMPWELAASYCNWLSRRDGLPPFYQIRYGEVLGVNPAATGYRLPSEAEWEWAARVDDRGEVRRFAWGAAWPAPRAAGNYGPGSAGGDDGFASVAPVGSFAANAHGLYDLGGNAAEWVHDYFVATPFAVATSDSLGPATGTSHVIKDASWLATGAETLELAHRVAGEKGTNDVGFRLARYAQ
jgi:formylglycine-generating enzyme required for sulfatase activity